MKALFDGYLILSALLMVGMALWLLKEDYDLRRDPLKRNVSKLGYNYRRGGLWWIWILSMAPFINLLNLYITIRYCIVVGKEERKVKTR